MSTYKAEYIWLDGTEPSASLRSKTKIVALGQEPPVWGFDGSSTNQAPGDKSDCVLQPVFVCKDPTRGDDNKLVLCEVLLAKDFGPHPTNTRAALTTVAKRFASAECLFGMEQEYTFFDGAKPLGWPKDGFPGPQGPYYCAIGAGLASGREIVEDHMQACLDAGLAFVGINAEVMPGQWEFQVGAIGPLEMADQLTIARYLLNRIAEDYDVTVSLAAKPVKGDWNGTGCHTNFSTKAMREGYQPIIDACEALGRKASLHIENYGPGIKDRLTGHHETCAWNQFKYGVSDRGASIRIPWHVAKDQKGYLEDRRPNANCDPYVVCRLMMETICGATT